MSSGSPLVGPSAAGDVKHKRDVKLKTKRIYFDGRTTCIVCQGKSGPCGLLSICNFLLLKGIICLDPNIEEVSEQKLVSMVTNILLNVTWDQGKDEAYNTNMKRKIADSVEILPNFTEGAFVSPKFNKCANFEFNRERIVFDLLNIPIYHAWLVDPKEDPKTASAIGDTSFETLVVNLVEYQTSKHGTSTETEQDRWRLIEIFLKATEVQITEYGLSRLHDEVPEQELCVFFQNNHFNTMLKMNGSLHLLVTHEGYIGNPHAWQILDQLQGGGDFVDTYFRPLSETMVTTDFAQAENSNRTKSSSDLNEQLARKKKETLCEEEQTRKVQTLNQSERHEGTVEVDTELGNRRKSIPRRKIFHIDKLLTEHGGEKVSMELQQQNKEILGLRAVLVNKNYEETYFGDWFEPHDKGAVSGRLRPAVGGKLQAYAAGKIPEITRILDSTENSGSSESLSIHDNYVPLSDADFQGDNVDKRSAPSLHTQNIQKPNVENPKAQSKKKPRPKVAVSTDGQFGTPESRTGRTTYGLRPQARINYTKSFTSGKRRSKPKNMGQLVDTSGARDQQIDVETDSDEAANDNLIGPDKNGDKSSFNKENRNLNAPRAPAPARSARKNHKVKKTAGPGAALALPPHPSLKSKKVAPQLLDKGANETMQGHKTGLNKTDAHLSDDPFIERGDPSDLNVSCDIASDHAEQDDGHAESAGEKQNQKLEEAAPPALQAKKHPEHEVQKAADDSEPPPYLASDKDGSGSEIGSKKAADNTRKDPFGACLDEEFVGYQYHKISRKDLKKEHLRYRALGELLNPDEYSCILLNPHHFDEFSGKSDCEYGVGIIGKSVPIELLKDKYGLNSENSEVLDKLKWEVGPHKVEGIIFENHTSYGMFLHTGKTRLVHAICCDGNVVVKSGNVISDLTRLSDRLRTQLLEPMSQAVENNLRLR